MIRILEVHPSRDISAKVKCSLHHLNLDPSQILAYEALSYCWGSSELNASIECNLKPMRITANLHSALLRLRYNDVPRYLWVDSVCIDQNNIPERNQQVQIMSKIYFSSRRIVIWLGDQANDSDTAMALIPRLSKASRTHLPIDSLQTPTKIVSSETDEWEIPPMYHPAYTTFMHLMRREYFSRVWIIQEVAFAHETFVYCGYSLHNPAWSELMEAFDFTIRLGFLNLYKPLLPHNLSAIHKTHLALTTSDFRNLKLSVLLSRHRLAMATDGRDKAFALFGLSREAKSEDLKVQINYETTTEDLFKELALEILRLDKNLDILSATALVSSSTTKTPSWVPDWTLRNAPRCIRYDGIEASEECKFQATKSFTSYDLQLADDNTLIVQGYILDEITSIGTSYKDYKSFNLHSLFSYFRLFCDELRVLSNWETVARARSGTKYFTGEDIFSVYKKTISTGSPSPNHVDSRDMDDHIRRYNYIRYLHLDYFTWSYKLTMFLLLLFISAIALLKQLFGYPLAPQKLSDNDLLRRYRRLFRTKKGYIGVAQPQVQIGDVVALIKGARVPPVLRRDGEKKDAWNVNGDCYVHGFMMGEGFVEGMCEELYLV